MHILVPMAEFSRTLEWPPVHSSNGCQLTETFLQRSQRVVFGTTENLRSNRLDTTDLEETLVRK